MSSLSERICCHDGCSESGSYVCSGCRSVRYCSREHQVSDWKNHKKVCNSMSNVKTENISYEVDANGLNESVGNSLPSYSVVPYLIHKDGVTPITNVVESFYQYRLSPQFTETDYRHQLYDLIVEFIRSEGVKTAAFWHTSEMDLGLMIQLDKIKVCPPRLVDKTLLASFVDPVDCIEVLPLFTVFYMLMDETERVSAMCSESLPSVIKTPTSLKNIMAGFRYFKANEERERSLLHGNADATKDRGYDDFRNVSYIAPFPGVDSSTVCWNFGCSSPGTMKCSKCKVALYCCRDHQAEHWKIGGHKQDCGVDAAITVQLNNPTVSSSSSDNKKFIVSIQMQMSTGEDTGSGAWIMVNDKNVCLATLNSYQDTSRESYVRLYHLINSRGFQFDTIAEGMGKCAFTYALREGGRLKIFVNQFLRTPYAW